MNDLLFGESLIDPEQPVLEKDLVFPVLLVLAKADSADHGPVSTYQFYTVFKNLFEMSEDDKEKVRADRNLSRFKRTVQNLFSHDLLTKDGWVERQDNGWVITPRGRAQLLDNLLPSEPSELGEEMRVVGKGDRIIEAVVGFQVLVRLAELQKNNATPVSISQLKKDIKASLPLTVNDLQTLKNRTDPKIDQIVRNLISHNTLTKNGWCNRNEKGLVITDKGKARVLDYLLEVFPAPDFTFLLHEENKFRSEVNARRSEVAAEAAAARKAKQKP